MEKETKSLILPLSHLYYLAQDPNNDTGYTIEEIQKLVEEHGWDYRIEANITTPVCVPLTKEQELEALKKQLVQVTDALKELESNPPTEKELKRSSRRDSKDKLSYEDRVQALKNSINSLTSDIAEMEGI
jgi:predicted  nucleic acid-binding Zn-ribbon protein